MKIVDFETFSNLPPGTIFSDFTPDVVEGLKRKGETIYIDGSPTDFYEASLVAECRIGELPAVDLTESRWGLYDWAAQFVIYEREDILKIAGALPHPQQQTQNITQLKQVV